MHIPQTHLTTLLGKVLDPVEGEGLAEVVDQFQKLDSSIQHNLAKQDQANKVIRLQEQISELSIELAIAGRTFEDRTDVSVVSVILFFNSCFYLPRRKRS